ncbi:hypothetical protein P3L10_004926 [Capsicum annuum]
MLADVDNPVVYRNITAISREMAILQLPCVDVVEDTTSNDVSSSDDFQDAPPATGQNKEKKKIDTASSPPHKKQKQVKSVPSSSNIPSRSSLKNTAIPSISISKASKRSLSPVAEHQTKKVVKAEIGDLCKLITDNFKSVMEAIKSIKIIEKGHCVEAVDGIPVIFQPLSQLIGTNRSSTPKQGDTCSVEL